MTDELHASGWQLSTMPVCVTRARACVPACVRARACACACACVCMCACGCVCACACVRVCVRARVCVCVYLCVCHHLSHPLCHLLCRGAIQEIAPARVEQVVLEPRSVQPSERPLAVHAAVLLSCLAILLAAAGQAGPGSTESGPQGHTSPLGLITEDILYLYRKSQMLFVGNSELELAL